MSPFSLFLRHLRGARGLKQSELARLLNYEGSYLSALERSQKGPPNTDFLTRLVRCLELNDEEQLALDEAVAMSKRQFSIPPQASEAEYRLINHLVSRLGSLNPVQIQLIELAIASIPNSVDSYCSAKQPTDHKGGRAM
ncbi:MAG TPA: helix-turn-helix transcriptional regulator [Azonexus sp.]|nr:helix-turn-helix transcriptional regulator [Azonexus sp.]